MSNEKNNFLSNIITQKSNSMAFSRALELAKRLPKPEICHQKSILITDFRLEVELISNLLVTEEENFLSLNSGSTKVLITGENEGLSCFDLKSNTRLWQSPSTDGEIKLANFSFTGNNIICSGENGFSSIYNVPAGKMRQNSKSAYCATFNYDDNFIAYGEKDGSIRIFDHVAGEEYRGLFGHSDCIKNIRFSPNGQFVLSQSNGLTRLWNITNCTMIRKYNAKTPFIFSRKSHFFLSVNEKNVIFVEEISTGRRSQKFVGNESEVSCIAISPDTKTVVSSSQNGTLILWDTGSGEILKNFQGLRNVLQINFSPGGTRLLVLTAKKLHIFSTPSSKKVF